MNTSQMMGKTVWYRHGSYRFWECFFQTQMDRPYERPNDMLRNCEEAMRGYKEPKDCLWFKNEADAREIIWC